MKKKYLKTTILTVAMTFMSMQAFSFQSNSAAKAPPQPAAKGVPPPPPGLPIDGFLTYLLIAGSVFGISRLRKKED